MKLHIHTQKNLYTSIIHTCQKVETMQISIIWWMRKQCGIAIQLINYPATKKWMQHWNMLHTLWTNLETIMLSQRSQTQKVIYCMITFKWNVKNRQSIETQCRLVVVHGWGGKKRGHRISFQGDWNILDIDSGDHYEALSVY